MGNKMDKVIIYLLVLLMIMTTWVAWITDEEIDAIHKTLDAILEQQTADGSRIDQMDAYNADQDARLDDLEYHDTIQDIRLRMHRDELTNAANLFTDLLEEVGDIEIKTNSAHRNRLGVKVSEKDIRDIAALVYLEAGGHSYKLQKAIASVVFNRMIKYHKSAQSVIYESGVFSPAYKVSRTIPSSSCLKAVREVLANGTTLPRSVVAFRTGHYHSFGRRYTCIDGVYFSSM